MKLFTKQFIALSVAGCSLLGVGAMAGQAHAAPSAPSTTATVVEDAVSKYTASDWRELQGQALKDGETALARYFAGRAATAERGGTNATTNGWTSWGRKAAIYALRHGSSKLPAAIRPYAAKIATALEATEVWEKAAVVWTLSRAGIPADVAIATADWLVLFLG